jgi:hypothetical protein
MTVLPSVVLTHFIRRPITDATVVDLPDCVLPTIIT